MHRSSILAVKTERERKKNQTIRRHLQSSKNCSIWFNLYIFSKVDSMFSCNLLFCKSITIEVTFNSISCYWFNFCLHINANHAKNVHMYIFDIIHICLNRCLRFGVAIKWFIMLLNLLLSGLCIDIFINNLRYLWHDFSRNENGNLMHMFCVRIVCDPYSIFLKDAKWLKRRFDGPLLKLVAHRYFASQQMEHLRIEWPCAWCLRLTNIIIFCWYFLIGFSCRLQALKYFHYLKRKRRKKID